MNKTLSTVGKGIIKDLLSKCTLPQQRMFKLMYGRNNGRRSVEDAELMDINDVVDQMDESKMNTAIDQCERTVDKNSKGL